MFAVANGNMPTHCKCPGNFSTFIHRLTHAMSTLHNACTYIYILSWWYRQRVKSFPLGLEKSFACHCYQCIFKPRSLFSPFWISILNSRNNWSQTQSVKVKCSAKKQKKQKNKWEGGRKLSEEKQSIMTKTQLFIIHCTPRRLSCIHFCRRSKWKRKFTRSWKRERDRQIYLLKSSDSFKTLSVQLAIASSSKTSGAYTYAKLTKETLFQRDNTKYMAGDTYA